MKKSIITLLTCIMAAAPTGMCQNLLTNPGFENSDFSGSGNGAYSFKGWEGTNARYHSHSIASGTVAAGTVTEGTKKLVQTWGGTLNTAAASRVPATPGTTFQLSYDQIARVRKFPDQKLGSFRFIEFFDEGGALIKRSYGTNSDYKVQHTGKDVWGNFTLRATAPPGTASVGVRVDSPAGAYSNGTSYEDDRSVEYDNFSLSIVPETIDRLAYRRAPRLVEPGKDAVLRIHHATLAARVLNVALVNSTGTEVASNSAEVAGGRFLNTSLPVPIPPALPDGTYAWRISLRASASAPDLTSISIPGVLVNGTVTLSAQDTAEFRADHPNIQYMGRIENLADGSRWLHWFSSEVRIRFSGTSATLRGTISDNGYGGAVSSSVTVIVDEDFANPLSIPLTSFNFTAPLVTGLPDGIHTLRIFKPNEAEKRIRVDAIRLDPGHGLLVPEPLPSRKIEIFGDSVTSGSNATPTFGGYAPLLGRELDADVHVISKGGTGVAASFSGLALLGDYYDNLSFPNSFDAGTGIPWDFARWTPDLVVIAIGHNDQFNGGAANFPAKYAEFKAKLRADYPPTTPLLSANTLISASLGHFQGAVEPLLAGDANHRFAFQPNSWENQVGGHPTTAGHAAQVHGDVRRFSQAEVIEEMLGAGLPAPEQLDAYQQWVTEQFTRSQIVAGDYGFLSKPADGKTPNLLRFALGAPATGPFPSDRTPALGLTGAGDPRFQFYRAKDGLEYTIQSSPDLVHWTDVAQNPGQVGFTAEFIDTEPPATPLRKFFRLRIARP